jgi:hypothetical protein
MEDPYPFPSFQCARAPLLGTASSYARPLSEDADSATARPGEGPCRLPEGLSGGAPQSGVQPNEGWHRAPSLPPGAPVLGGRPQSDATHTQIKVNRVRGRSRLHGSLARAACGWVSEGVTPFLPDHRPTGHYLSVNAGWPTTLPRSAVLSSIGEVCGPMRLNPEQLAVRYYYDDLQY